MMIFLFISVSYMINVTNDRDRMERIAEAYENTQDRIYWELEKEFKDDFPKWNAILDRKDLSIRFQEPEVLFGVGESTINDKFKMLLDDFFPRYIRILSSNEFKNKIEEIRIEGHTSSEWNGGTYGDIAYLNNMELSQGRTRNVLVYCLSLTSESLKDWVKSKLTANGLSSSRIITVDGIEDRNKSRRVEFKVRTNAEQVINNIIMK